MQHQTDHRGIFERYIGEIATNCEALTGTNAKKIYDALKKQATRKTREADQKLDLDGKVVSEARLEQDEDVIIIEERQPIDDVADGLFDGDKPSPRKKKARKKTRKKKKKTS